MVATTTTKLALTKPDSTDLVDISVLNSNADKIDAASGLTIVTSTTRPNSPWNGQTIFETDTANQYVWVSATSTWVRLSGTPAGIVISTASAAAPAGWLMCNGAVYPNTTYPDLAAAIGNTYGGVSGTSFAVPDLTGRVIVGKSASGTFSALNNNGGAETVTLDISQIPSHNHGGTTGNNGGHSHNVLLSSAGGTSSGYSRNGAGHSLENAGSTSTNGDHNHSIPSQGGGGAHNNLQPYRVLNYIIKL